jgi:hypothetical protein
MSDIQIRNLSGYELFNDSESFMVELNDKDEQIFGGKIATSPCTCTCVCPTVIKIIVHLE